MPRRALARGDPNRPGMFCLPLRPGLKRLRKAFKPEGVGLLFAYIYDATLALASRGRGDYCQHRARVLPSPRNELVGSVDDAVTNPSKAVAVALPSQRHSAEGGGAAMVGVPIGTDHNGVERVLGV